MFEKEAEEYADWFWEASPSAQRAIKQAYQQGAELGYTKANERLIKANEIIKGLMRFCRCFAQHHTEDIRYKEAEQFLREEEE